MPRLPAHLLLVSAGIVLGTTVDLACLVRNDSHCYFTQGNATCQARYGDERPYCVTNCYATPSHDGCIFLRPEPLDDACYSPCGNQQTLADDPTCLTAGTGTSTGATTTADTLTSADSTTTSDSSATSDATSTSSSSSTTSSASTTASTSSTTSSPECQLSPDCPNPDQPICVDGTCSPCGVAESDACALRDASLPVCTPAGTCVQCTPEQPDACTDTTPICDPDTSACVPCSAHEQCDSGACNPFSGACIPNTCTLHIDGDGGADYTSIQAAINDASDPCILILHERSGQVAYQESLDLHDTTLALFAAPGESPRLQGTGGNPTLLLHSNATLLARGLLILGNTSGPGLDLQHASVHLLDSQVSNNGGPGITASNGSLVLQTAQVIGNSGGGVLLGDGANLIARTTIVGSDAADLPALSLDGDASADLLYVTLFADFGEATALTCSATQTPVLRNSILVSRSDIPEVACPGATISTSALENPFTGPGNRTVGNVSTSWFDSVAGGQFTLSDIGAGIFTGIARWRSGDPTTDIDGDLRPTSDNAQDFPGADIP